MEFSGLRDGLGIARDIAILLVAVESIVIGLAVLILLFMVIRLVRLVRGQAARLTDLAGEQTARLTDLAADTLSTSADVARSVRGTTEFVGDRATRPIIEVLAAVTAAAQFARAVMSDNHQGDGKA
ncbi:MAG TPA: hypothetical protein VGK54_03245 [Chloroflexota bacterium]|jgi:hypothetical protein